ncbi:uncharacterized protein CLUP02_12425 [Colletotrichum lupini]|uniref:Uncharacterized protein n=1 Tax=Colletotrichum lupini TaxID=145971 RepID=A0A9Q8T0G6_9PEZI|nr:uncharacterized protein CLUP02_12425 [Colletotrichum lupini]UQC86923.1 hypothetical protein CLUP02_12425 [Colletotrichum lupini]
MNNSDCGSSRLNLANESNFGILRWQDSQEERPISLHTSIYNTDLGLPTLFDGIQVTSPPISITTINAHPNSSGMAGHLASSLTLLFAPHTTPPVTPVPDLNSPPYTSPCFPCFSLLPANIRNKSRTRRYDTTKTRARGEKRLERGKKNVKSEKHPRDEESVSIQLPPIAPKMDSFPFPRTNEIHITTKGIIQTKQRRWNERTPPSRTSIRFLQVDSGVHQPKVVTIKYDAQKHLSPHTHDRTSSPPFFQTSSRRFAFVPDVPILCCNTHAGAAAGKEKKKEHSRFTCPACHRVRHPGMAGVAMWSAPCVIETLATKSCFSFPPPLPFPPARQLLRWEYLAPPLTPMLLVPRFTSDSWELLGLVSSVADVDSAPLKPRLHIATGAVHLGFIYIAQITLRSRPWNFGIWLVFEFVSELTSSRPFVMEKKMSFQTSKLLARCSNIKRHDARSLKRNIRGELGRIRCVRRALRATVKRASRRKPEE